MIGGTLKEMRGAMVRIQPDDDTVLPEPSEGFISTPYVEQVTERSLTYLKAGYPIHFAGPAGTGKTTMAFHLAAKVGRPVTLIHGDDEFTSSDLVGRDAGYHRYKLVDNYIHSVLKTEEDMKSFWVDNRLTTACQNGDTLIYDEFNRSRPEANNALLSILSERILSLPKLRMSGAGYMAVHPEFRAILTSNPEEYAGVHKTQDALMDRLITVRLGHFDPETQIQITMAKSRVVRQDAEVIVEIVNELRGIGANNHRPTIRTCIVIARVLSLKGARARTDDPVFQWVCRDVLGMGTAKITKAGRSVTVNKLDEVIRRVFARRTDPSVEDRTVTETGEEKDG